MTITRNNHMMYACQRIGIEISEVSHALLDSEWSLKNVRSSFTRIYFPIAGEGTLIFDGREVPILPHNIYVIPAGVRFSSRCDSSLEKIYVHLTVTHPDNPDIFSGIDDCITIVDSGRKINEIAELYNENTLEAVMSFKRILYEILSDSLTWFSPRGRALKVYSKETRDALDFIDRSISASLTVDDISRALFIPKSTLQRRFKGDTGRPIGQYMDECLNRRIERELLDPALSIGEISDRLGFCDQFYFSRKFKKTHGVSPRVFRQKNNIK